MTVEQAKQVLKDNGYYVENLWQVADVQTKFDVDAETAQEILDKTLKNPNIFDDIWEVMEYVGEEMGFELLEL